MRRPLVPTGIAYRDIYRQEGSTYNRQHTSRRRATKILGRAPQHTNMTHRSENVAAIAKAEIFVVVAGQIRSAGTAYRHSGSLAKVSAEQLLSAEQIPADGLTGWGLHMDELCLPCFLWKAWAASLAKSGVNGIQARVDFHYGASLRCICSLEQLGDRLPLSVARLASKSLRAG